MPVYPRCGVRPVRGEHCHLIDEDGTRYLDFASGIAVNLLGHSHRGLIEAIQQQAETLLFYSNAVYSPIRAEAAEKLVALAPDGLGRVFFCNSGTEANEAALKLARAFTGKQHVIATKGGFHGRTLGSLATTWGDKYHAPYRSVLPETRFVPFGWEGAVAEALEAGDVAAVILEPIQSMAGVFEAPSGYYQALRRLCDEHDALLIFDEVQTGVGRTGTFSYGEHVGVTPDLITLAKSLGAGVPVGATLVHDRIAATVKPGDQGTTFGGGMLAMAAVAATLDALTEDGLMPRAVQLFGTIKTALASLDGVVDVRGRGALLGVELDRPAGPVRDALRDAGILVGTSGHAHSLRLMPPLTTPFEAVDSLAEALAEALS
ncbi:MAG: aspartate aminotransferase family protein [Bacteroidota bacterium]